MFEASSMTELPNDKRVLRVVAPVKVVIGEATCASSMLVVASLFPSSSSEVVVELAEAESDDTTDEKDDIHGGGPRFSELGGGGRLSSRANMIFEDETENGDRAGNRVDSVN